MGDRGYYAVIPADIRYAEIPNGAKLLYGEITALCNAEGYCWSTNAYFSNLYGVDSRTISRWLNSLEKNGYIKKELVYKENSKEVDKRIISITPMTKMSGGGDNNFNTPGDKNVLENNTDINNKKSIAKAILEKEPEASSGELAKKLKEEADELRTKQLVNEFNRICTKLPKAMKVTSARTKKVKARLKTFEYKEIVKAFEKANNSYFLTGSNGWKANFDWFFENDSNIQKVLEGNYDNNKVDKPPNKTKFNNFEQRKDTDFKALEKKLLGG